MQECKQEASKVISLLNHGGKFTKCIQAPLNRIIPCLFITKTCLFTYIENLTTKLKEKKTDKKSDTLSYFYSKHRLCILVRTASTRLF